VWQQSFGGRQEVVCQGGVVVPALLLCDVCHDRKNELEELMLLNLSKKTWTQGLLLQDYDQHATANDKVRLDTAVELCLLNAAALVVVSVMMMTPSAGPWALSL
jgi:hypothetical protein